MCPSRDLRGKLLRGVLSLRKLTWRTTSLSADTQSAEELLLQSTSISKPHPGNERFELVSSCTALWQVLVLANARPDFVKHFFGLLSGQNPRQCHALSVCSQHIAAQAHAQANAPLMTMQAKLTACTSPVLQVPPQASHS